MKKILSFLPVAVFLFLTIFIFRQYVFSGKIPFAGNLLVSFYQPWKSYSWGNYGTNGPANKPIGFDSLRIFYPLRNLTIAAWKKNQISLWNPYDFAGNTQLATYQSAVFFPLTPLFLFLPLMQAWSLVVFLGPFLTSIFTYAFLRSLKMSKQASTLGALSFGFSGAVIVLLEESFMSVYSLMFLPLMMLGIWKLFQEKKVRWFGLIVLAIACSIFSGWFQSTLYAMLVSFVWAVFLAVRNKNYKNLLLVSFGFLIALFLSGPHLIPNIESYVYSARGTTDAKFLFTTYLVSPMHLLTYIVPDFFGNPGTYNYFGKGFYYETMLYIGIVGLFFGLFSSFIAKKSSLEWFFLIAWIVTLSLGISLPTSWFFLYNLHIPLLSTILPSRIFLLSAFCLSMLSGFGWDHFFAKKHTRPLLLTGGIFVIVLATAWTYVLFVKHFHPLNKENLISYRNLFLPTVLSLATLAVALVSRIVKIRKIDVILFFSIALFGIVYFSGKYLYFSEKQFTFPNTPILTKLQQISGNNRIWSFGEGYLDRNFATYYHLQSPEGYDSFYIRSFGEFIEASKNGGKFTNNIPRADAQLIAISYLSEIATNPSLEKALDVMGVKYIFAKQNKTNKDFLDKNPDYFLQPIWSDEVYIIYENKHALPRAFLVSKFIVAPNPSKQLEAIFAPTTDLSKMVILNKKPASAIADSSNPGSAQITEYKPEKVTIRVYATSKSLLFLSDNNYPGWHAYVDGKETEILTSDHTFRAIVVDKGTHEAQFVYRPLSFTIGLYSSLLGILLFVIAGFTITRR